MDLEELAAHRDAGYVRVAEVGDGRGEVDCGGIHSFANEAVGKTRSGVGLEGERGNTEENRSHHGGAAGVSAYPDDDVRLEMPEQDEASHYAQRQVSNGS